MITPLEQRTLNMLRQRFGEFNSAADVLDLALLSEQTKRDCGPGDPAFTFFAREQAYLERYAVLLEKEQAPNA